MSTYFDPSERTNITNASDMSFFQKIQLYYQQINDKALFYKTERWIVVAVLVFLYCLRLIFKGGYHALTYCIGIHILNSFLGFISPLEDPDEAVDGQSFLPQKYLFY